jgi:CRP-like cAMP-binding protein
MPNPLTMKLEQFTRFTPEERLRLDQLLRYPTRTFSRRESFIREGQKVDEIHLVTSGLAARRKILPDGNRQFMAFLFPGDLCDLEVFILKQMDHDIVALSEVTCVLIPAKEIEGLLTESSNITRAMWWSTMTDSAVLREWIVNHGSRDARARVAHLFYEMLVRNRIVGEAADNTFAFPLTQEEFADATGITPVHLSRVLGELRQEGVVELQARALTILDPHGLKRIAGYEANYLHLDRTEGRDPDMSDRAADLVEAAPQALPHQATEGLDAPLRTS